ncbi:MAG: lactate racemase domain-containing protein [Acidimicrobiales bacterium]
MSPRKGIVIEVDTRTPPVLFHHGEGFRLEKLPRGSRIIYPNEPLPGVEDPQGEIRHALHHPLGECEPLPALLFAGMKLTIAFDDISLPLPPMESPDVRQRVIEAVLDEAAAAGVDDVHIIAALALHRRMNESELRHAVGDRVYEAFAPNGQLYNFDAEDPEDAMHLGETEQGEEVIISKRAATSDLLIYVNINLVSLDGGHKSVATGLSTYQSIRHHHNPETMENSKSFMDNKNSELHTKNWRQGEVIKNTGLKIFQIETTLNTATFPPAFDFLQKREWEWNLRDRASYYATTKSLKRTPSKVRHKIFHSIRSPYKITSVNAGEVEAVHEVTISHVYEQQMVEIEGQSDIMTMGIPYVGPYNVGSIMNPILVAVMGLGYFFNLYRGKPIVREGGVVIMSHPTTADFHPVHHPSYIDFFEEVLSETTDPHKMSHHFEERYAKDEWYIHLYRNSYAYHGVHPFYMWYWTAHALKHLGGVFIVGGDPRTVKRLGYRPASTLQDALEMATDIVGPSPSLTHFKNPPMLMADVQ